MALLLKNKTHAENAWEIKKTTTRVVDRICAVYVLYNITNSDKSQDNIFKPAEFQEFIRLFHHHIPTNSANHDAEPMRHFRLFQSVPPIRPGI